MSNGRIRLLCSDLRHGIERIVAYAAHLVPKFIKMSAQVFRDQRFVFDDEDANGGHGSARKFVFRMDIVTVVPSSYVQCPTPPSTCPRKVRVVFSPNSDSALVQVRQWPCCQHHRR